MTELQIAVFAQAAGFTPAASREMFAAILMVMAVLLLVDTAIQGYRQWMASGREMEWVMGVARSLLLFLLLLFGVDEPTGTGA